MSNIDRQRLIEARKQCRYSQKYVAVSIGVAPATVSQWESGAKNPSLENTAKLSDLYGVTMEFLLGREDGKKERPAPDARDGLKEEIIDLIGQLNEEELPQIRDYVEWLKSRHAK